LTSDSHNKAKEYINIMSIHPVDANSNYNYSRLVQLFIDHSIVNNDDYIQKNLVELHVYVETNTVEFIEEQPSYRFSQLTSDLGGVRKAMKRYF